MKESLPTLDKSLALSCTFKMVQGTLIAVETPAASPSGPITEGTIVDGRYQIKSLLGQGGMGAVYCAHHLSLKNDVALKTFRFSDISATSSWERFQREAKAIARLDNEHIVRVFDFGVSESNLPYYTMELLEGESLAQRIRREGALPLPEVLRIFTAVASGLVSAHAKGIVHRDLKPENIFLTLKDSEVQSVKLVDFGIARLAGTGDAESQRLTKEGTIFGSPLYMSPEQSLGDDADWRSDIYSYGCAIFEALTGKPPLARSTAFATILAHQNEVPPRLSEVVPEKNYPSWLDSLVAQMLAKKREKRVQDFQEVLDIFAYYSPGKTAKNRSVTESSSASARSAASGSGEKHQPAESIRRTKALPDSRPYDRQTARFEKRGSKLKIIFCILAICGILVAGALGLRAYLAKRNDAIARQDTASATQKVAPHAVSRSGIHFFRGVENTPRGPVRVYKFPPVQQMGFFRTGSPTGPLIRCIGEVRVPADQWNTYIPDGVLYAKSNFFEGFSGDDLSSITFDPQVLSGMNWGDGAIHAIACITGLEQIDLSGTDVGAGAVADLGAFAKLTALEAGRSKLSGRDLTRLASLYNLKELGAARLTEMSDFLSSVDATKLMLTRLDLSDCQLCDGDLKSIEKIKSLKSLNLTGNKLSDLAIESVKAALPDCHITK